MQHLLVQQQCERSRPDVAELAQHDVLAHAAHHVLLCKSSSLEKDVHSFLEAAPHERPCLHAVDAMACNSHQVAAVGHHLHQNSEVAVVDVGAVKFDDASQLFEQRVSHRLDAQHLEHLNQVVAERARVVHIWMVHHLPQVAALGIQHPLLLSLVRLFVVKRGSRGAADEHLADVHHAAQTQLGQHICLNALQEDVVAVAAGASSVVVLGRRLVVDDADAQHQLLGVVISEDDTQVICEHGVDALRNVRHGQLLVHHHLAVQLDAQHPRREAIQRQILVRHLVVAFHELMVLGQDCVLGVRVVVDLAAVGHAVQRRVLQPRLRRLRLLLVASDILLEVHRQAGRLHLLCDVDDLLEARHAKSHVLGGHACVVECVQRHLSRRFADGLRSHGADHLARHGDGLLEALLNLANHP